MTGTARLRQRLADRITGQGLTDPAWRKAVEAVPREVFLGNAVFRPATDARGSTVYHPVRRQDVPEAEWLSMAYRNETWVTQVGGVDAVTATGPVYGLPTSSSTLPSLVVRMLEAADIGEGDRVREIGTGTGYSTAILCHRVGDRQVTSVEVDPATGARARDALHAAGHAPDLVIADGLDAREAGTDFDRIVATCSVRGIPYPWVWQVHPGGTVTTCLGGWSQASGLVNLTVRGDGTAEGRFTGEEVAFMLARAHQPPPRPTFTLHTGHERRTFLAPARIWSWTGRFLAQLAAPSAELLGAGPRAILVDTATGSQAWTEDTGSGPIVHQHGPLPLWDAVEHAFAQWEEVGAPAQDAFGLTVDGEEQRVWIGSPSGPAWRLPV
ncbi:ATP-grasp peptide maturase system methyltransferase [Kitasatospora sp. NPDC088783]|uniref:ATP-grasp peptide maturase system methyltransferase n=1 Tax=Kitasatospora sp. NPDC088783 TaxID=3364077 RepID=UPI0037F885BE